MERGAERNRGSTGRGGRPRRETAPPDDTDREPEPTRSQRLADGAETGVRRFVQSLAVLLWVPFGFVFWLPFLLRRTLAYVLTVLYAGLTGGRIDRAERRWEQSVAFYQLGFRRIIHAFGPEDGPPGAAGRAAEEPEPADGPRRLLLEVVWAAVVWGGALWLTGVWPDAPNAVRSAMAGLWEMAAGAGQQVDAWARELLRG